MKILTIPGNLKTAKSFPRWDALTATLKDHEIRTMTGILKEREIVDLINWCDIWISIDSFVPHLVAYHHLKRGIVIWGKSDPLIFGYPTNINLLKDRRYLRLEQFRWWVDEPINEDAFVTPEIIVKAIETW